VVPGIQKYVIDCSWKFALDICPSTWVTITMQLSLTAASGGGECLE
jgi:hypothetical protein